jgi:branched-chain amino acid transport system permease protein
MSVRRAMTVPRVRRVAVVLGLVALVAVPHVGDAFQVTLVVRGLVWATLAASVWFLLRICDLPSLGHAAFFGIGAYTAGLAVTRWQVDNVFAALGLAIVVTAVLSLPIAVIAGRLRNMQFILVTLAFAEMTRSLATRWAELGGTDGLVGVIRPGAWPFGLDLSDATTYYYFALAVLLAGVALLVVVVRSPFGAVLRGIRDSEQRVAALGYNPLVYRVAAFVLSAVVAGSAGVVHTYLNRFANPTDVAPLVSARALLIVVLGGAAIAGPVTVAILLTIIEDALSSHTDRWLGVLGALYVVGALASGAWTPAAWRGAPDRRHGGATPATHAADDAPPPPARRAATLERTT